MAIGYSVEYDYLYVDKPATRTFATLIEASVKRYPFTFDNGAGPTLGTIGDLLYLVKVPAVCDVYMFDSRFAFSAWDTNTTIDIGWLAYTGYDGVPVAADDNGLLDGLDVDAAGWWYAGVHHSSTDTTVHAAPIVQVKSFRAKEEVTLTAVFYDAAPTASDTFSGFFTVLVP